MARALLLLVRHGHASGDDAVDPPLSAEGRTQTAALATRLAQLSPATVLHSPRRRARETAALIKEALSDTVVEESAMLDDRTPVPSPSREPDYSAAERQWLAATPSLERDVDGEQITLAMEDLVATTRSAGRPLVAVTHAFVVGWIVRAVLGAPVPAWLRLVPDNPSLTVLDCGPTEPRLVAYNDTGHLQPR